MKLNQILFIIASLVLIALTGVLAVRLFAAISPPTSTEFKVAFWDDQLSPAKIETNEKTGLKVMSALLIPIFDDQKTGNQAQITDFQPKMKELKIWGELKNTSSKIIPSAIPLATFFDNNTKVLTVKIAAFDPEYVFPKLAPGDQFLYAVTISEPPEKFASVQISFRPDTLKEKNQVNFSTKVKVEGKNLSEKIASSSAGKEGIYYVVNGSIVNIGQTDQINVKAFAWLKNDNNQVVAWNKQAFPADLFTPGQKEAIAINLFPVLNLNKKTLEIMILSDELN